MGTRDFAAINMQDVLVSHAASFKQAGCEAGSLRVVVLLK